MFCPNCGKEVNEDARFCPHCGETTAAPKQKNPFRKETSTGDSSSSAGKSKSVSRNKLLGIIAAVLAVIIAAVVVMLVIVNRPKPYERDLAQMVKYLNEQYDESEETLYKLNCWGEQYCADEMWEQEVFGETYLGVWEDKTYDFLLDAYDDLVDEYGSDYKISYEVVNAQELSNKKLRLYEEVEQESWTGAYLSERLRKRHNNNIEDMLDEWIEGGHASEDTTTEQFQEYISAYDSVEEDMKDKCGSAKCTEGYKLTVRFRIKGSGGSATKTNEVYVYNFGDVWNTDAYMTWIARLFLED